jgi:division/cell wall cluster transcriptional repressor MraZ
MSSSIRLLGEHPATLDAEGRIQLPIALRDEWNLRKSDFALMANLEPDGSLCLRQREDWDSFTEDLRRSPGLSPRARQTLLLYAAHSSPVRCDKTWRIRVPDALLELIGVDRRLEGQRDVVVVGNFDDVRLWSREGWQSFRASALDEYAAGMDELLNGIPLGPDGLVSEKSA